MLEDGPSPAHAAKRAYDLERNICMIDRGLLPLVVGLSSITTDVLCCKSFDYKGCDNTDADSIIVGRAHCGRWQHGGINHQRSTLHNTRVFQVLVQACERSRTCDVRRGRK